LLKEAIAAKRLIAFTLGERPRVAEPHDFGLIDGAEQLLFYQVGGQSASKAPSGWRRTPVAKISELRLLQDRFPGPRAAPSGQHVRWDALIATVSQRS
jgi:hypothetical protein